MVNNVAVNEHVGWYVVHADWEETCASKSVKTRTIRQKCRWSSKCVFRQSFDFPRQIQDPDFSYNLCKFSGQSEFVFRRYELKIANYGIFTNQNN